MGILLSEIEILVIFSAEICQYFPYEARFLEKA